MHTDLITGTDGQRTQVGPDPLDYVLRYSVCDYDCYHQGRYIGSRATLPNAVEAVEHEQAKAARHPQPSHAANTPLAAYQDELLTITARLQDLAGRLAIHPAEHTLMRTHLTLTHIRITAALRSVQGAERSLALAQRPPAVHHSTQRPDREEYQYARRTFLSRAALHWSGAMAVLSA